MGEKAIENRIKKLKAIEEQMKALELEADTLKEEIKKEMKARGAEEVVIGDWIVKFKSIMSNKFNSKAFAADHPILYKKYMASSQTMRFTVQ